MTGGEGVIKSKNKGLMNRCESGSIHDTAMIMMVISVQVLGSGSIHDTAMIMIVISVHVLGSGSMT
jgi:hypothetical protein